jgi:3-oxoacyl-[acyl-carrier protein] reductase
MTHRKLALITGGGTGVGAATALRLAALGCDLVLTWSRSEAEARQTALACEAAGAAVLLLQGDVADDAHCKAVVAAALKRFGRLDVLVNNAGMTSFAGAANNWDAIDAEVVQRIVAVNALGGVQMIRAAAPHLKAAKGAIVNISFITRALTPSVRVNAGCPARTISC